MPKPTFLHRVAATIAAFFLHLVGRTSFVETWDHPSYLPYRRNMKPMIFGFWHNTQVFLSYHHRFEPTINIMVSQSKDGEYIAQVMAWMGINAVRGSSSRGGLRAFVEICQKAEKGEQIGFTPDGPRGPAYSVQDGIVIAAKRLGIPIVPLHTLSRRRLTFNTWDKFMIALPFSHIVVSHGQPFTLSEKVDDETAKAMVQALLHKNREACERALAEAPGYWQSLRASALMLIYNIMMIVLLPVWVPMLFAKHGFKRSAAGLGERLGRSKPERPSENRLWFHAASMGEWQALRPLFDRMSGAGDALITTSAPEVREQIRAERPGVDVYLVPADVRWIVKPWIKRWNPTALIVVETELWPNLVEACYAQYVPIFIVNGRLSARSVKGWRRASSLIRRLLRRISIFYVRTEDDAAHFRDLGAPAERIVVTGNLKVDNLNVLEPTQKSDVRRRLWGETTDVVITAGSTWDTEEEMILNVLNRTGSEKTRLVIAPRRASRFDAVAQLLEKKGIPFERWSKIRDTGRWSEQVLLVDTLGDLKKMYEASDIAFIGGSFVPRGGQNPLEAAACGIPLVFGASMENFSAEAESLVEQGAALQARSADEIVNSLTQLAAEVSRRKVMGSAAAHAVRNSQGVADRIAVALQEQMEILK